MTADRSIKSIMMQVRDLDLIDAQILLSYVLHTTRAALYSHDERVLNDYEWAMWLEVLEKRRKGMPIAYIIGQKECFGMMFYITPDVLIPRPDTECLIETVLSLVSTDSLNILDLCTGSGVIACSLAASLPHAQVIASDISIPALDVANKNIQRHQLNNMTTRLSDMYDAIPETFDVIVSNPPYLAPDDTHLSGEIRFEPLSALVADEQGFALLRRAIEGAMVHLNLGGYVCLEHGFEQAPGVRLLLVENGFTDIVTVNDLAGNERVTYGRLS